LDFLPKESQHKPLTALSYQAEDSEVPGDLDTLLAETTVDALVQTHPDQPLRQSTPPSFHEDGNGDLTDPIYPTHFCH
jgi:hypothetical protein